MSMIFEPKLDLPAGGIAPDNYFWVSEKGVPPNSFVISRNRDGTTASVYGDLFWDLSSYHAERKPRKIIFEYWDSGEITIARESLLREIRWLMFSLIWLRKGNPLSIGSLRNYLIVLRVMAKFCEVANISLNKMLGDEKKLWQFVNSDSKEWINQSLGSLLSLYAEMDRNCLGINIVGSNFIKLLQRRGQAYRTTLKQHAPIPTNLYNLVLSKLVTELEEWRSVESELLNITYLCGKDSRMGRCVAVQKYQKKVGSQIEILPTFQELSSENINRYLASKGHSQTLKGVSRLICEIQMTVKLTIQAFTGMRDDEAMSLPYDCIETTTADVKTHYIINGRTTKLAGGRIKRTRWVTNVEGYHAILLAQKIAETIYSIYQVSLETIFKKTNNHPLFVSTAYLGFATEKMIPENGHFAILSANISHMLELRRRLSPIIQESDVRELEQIDPHRAWRSEDMFQVGKPWAFSSHQLRRSLALYAQRSGLVSLPSLRRQLQHITIEMSRYYAKGSAYAKNFIGDDKQHFGLEWQETQAESAGLSYILNVLLSDDTLFGGHASWVEHRLKDADGKIMVDRGVTMKRFNKGELAYKETVIGGCTSTGDCNMPALNWMSVGCLQDSCRNLVGNLSKLDRVITAQTRMIEGLEQNSVEYRTEHNDLQILIHARRSAIKQKIGTSS